MPFRKTLWLFPIAVTLHNSEEAVFMPSWIAGHADRLPLHPSAAAIRLGLLSLTLAAFAIAALSARSGKRSVWAYLLFGYIAAMLLNVFVPHVPATILFGAYTPGVLTAVSINVPVMSVLLIQSVRERWVAGIEALIYAVLVPIAIGGSILVFFKVA